MDRYDADVMDDMMYDAAEGPARSAYDEYEEGEGYDEWDAGEEGDDEFIGRLLGGLGQLVGGGGGQFEEFDEFEEGEEFDAGDEFGEGEAFEFAEEEYDAMEEAVADALDAGDGDEFFRRLAN